MLHRLVARLPVDLLGCNYSHRCLSHFTAKHTNWMRPTLCATPGGSSLVNEKKRVWGRGGREHDSDTVWIRQNDGLDAGTLSLWMRPIMPHPQFVAPLGGRRGCRPTISGIPQMMLLAPSTTIMRNRHPAVTDVMYMHASGGMLRFFLEVSCNGFPSQRPPRLVHLSGDSWGRFLSRSITRNPAAPASWAMHVLREEGLRHYNSYTLCEKIQGYMIKHKHIHNANH